MLSSRLRIIFGETSVQILCPVLNWALCPFINELWELRLLLFVRDSLFFVAAVRAFLLGLFIAGASLAAGL